MDIKKKFGTDAELESETGVWLDFGKGCRVRIHRAGGSNRKYQATAARILKPFRHQIATNSLSNEDAAAAYAEIYVESVILDWEGIEDGEETIDFNDKARSIEFLKEVPEFLNMIRMEAENAATFRDLELEDEAGNSEPG